MRRFTCLLLLLLCLLASVAGAQDSLLESVGRPEALGWQSWGQKDRGHVEEIYRRMAQGEAPGPQLYGEWLELQKLIVQAERQNFSLDEDVGVRVYSAPHTGLLQALGQAMAARERLMQVLLARAVPGSGPTALPPLDEVHPPPGTGGLLPAAGKVVPPGEYTQVPHVLRALQALKKSGVPDALLDGSVFIAPFTFPSLPDSGWVMDRPRLSLVLASAGLRVPGHPGTTLSHLLGHHAQRWLFGPSPEEAPEAWQRYLSLRGEAKPWYAGDDWARDSRENWAEDFRLAYGSGQAGFPHRGAYGGMRTQQVEAFKALFLEQAAAASRSLTFTAASLTDFQVIAPSAPPLHTGSIMTPARSLTVLGSVGNMGDERPRIEVVARRHPKDPWKTVGGGARVDTGGNFSATLVLGPGAWEVEVRAHSKTQAAAAPFRALVVTRRLAGNLWQVPEMEDMHGHWAAEKVRQLMELGAIAGFPDRTFRPADPVTRGQFLKVLIVALRSEGLIDASFSLYEQPPFEDVDDHWARPYIDEAVQLALFATSEYYPYFGPDEPVTRAEIGRFAGAALEKHDFDVSAGARVGVFTDGGEVDSWRRPMVGMAVKHGILTGYPDGAFRPMRTASRAEAAVIVVRLLERLKELKSRS